MFKRKYFLREEDPAAGSGGGDPAPATIVIPDNWKDAIAEEFRVDKSMEHIKSVEDMAKSYINAQKHMGSDKIVIPGQYATDEDWSNIHSKLGRPDTAEGYDLSLQEGSKISADSFTSLKAKAHELGILPSQLKGIVDYQEAQITANETSFKESIEARVAESTGKLKTEWGTEYDTRLKTAANMVQEFGGEELSKYLNETGYGNDAMLVKTFYKIAQGMGEGRFKGDDNANGSGFTPEAAKNKILELQSHEAFNDAQHPMHKKIMEDRDKMYPLAYPEMGNK